MEASVIQQIGPAGKLPTFRFKDAAIKQAIKRKYPVELAHISDELTANEVSIKPYAGYWMYMLTEEDRLGGERLVSFAGFVDVYTAESFSIWYADSQGVIRHETYENEASELIGIATPYLSYLSAVSIT